MNPLFNNEIVQEDLKKIVENSAVDFESFRGKTVLITGAYGMLASYLVFALCYASKQMGNSIRILAVGRNIDKAKRRFAGIFDNGNSPLSFIVADIADGLPSDIEDSDYVIHAASPASTELFSRAPADVLKANVLGTFNTLEYAQKCNSKRYLFISSGAVYGSLSVPTITEDCIGEVNQLSVRACYEEGKRAAEALCAAWHRQYGLGTVIARPSHTYGPTMDIENDHRVFSEFINDAIHGRNIVMKSPGYDHRSFCYIADATQAYLKILLDGQPGHAYNTACPIGDMSILDFATLIAKLSPYPNIEVIRSEHNEEYSNAAQEIAKETELSVKKLAELGVICNTSPEEGFARTISALASSKRIGSRDKGQSSH